MSKAGKKRARPVEEALDGAPINPRKIEADDEEERLASLVFGSAVASQSRKQARRKDDADVAATSRAGATSSRGAWASLADDGAAAAWQDDDDDKLRIDISGTARLRKLRTDHGEKVVSGSEYQQRLRGQFAARAGGGAGAGAGAGAGGGAGAAASATPEWAKLPEERAGGRAAAKPSRTRSDSNASGSDSEYSDEEEQMELDEAEALLRRTDGLLQASTALPSGTIRLSRLRDANLTDPSRSVVNALGFHPGAGSGSGSGGAGGGSVKGSGSGSILMVGSVDQRLRFFRIDGKKNSRILSCHLKDLPVTSASWTADGREVIATGRRPFFYTYDVHAGAAHRIPRIQGRDEKSLESCVVSPADPRSDTSVLAFLGADGTTILVSARTKQWVGNLKQAGEVRAAAFSRGSTSGGGGAGALEYPELLTTGTHGEVYRWCLRTLRCLGKHVDEGSTGGTALAVTPNGSQYAVGSNMGVVNTYDAASVAAAAAAPASAGPRGIFSAAVTPKPVKTLMSLTTAVDTLSYSHDGGLLLMASQRKRDALKLVHRASGTVFANWPTDSTPLRFVTATAFSPNSGYLTIGNDAGKVLLYRLHHYTSA